MSLIKCKKCGSEVVSNAETCSKCGVKIAAKSTSLGQVFGVFILAIVIVSVFGGIFKGDGKVRDDSKGGGDSKVVNIIQPSTVDTPLSLKDLALGINFTSLKIKPSGKLSDGQIMFNYDYFGSSRSVLALTNSAGIIYSYKLPLGGDFREVKAAIEEKYSAENNRPIKFNCNVDKFTSADGSANITSSDCKLSRGTEILTVKESIIEKNSSSARYELPVATSTTIELVDTKIAQEVKAKIEAEAAEKARKINENKKKDI